MVERSSEYVCSDGGSIPPLKTRPRVRQGTSTNLGMLGTTNVGTLGYTNLGTQAALI